MRLTVTSHLTLDSILLRGDVVEEVAKLKRQPGNELQSMGARHWSGR